MLVFQSLSLKIPSLIKTRYHLSLGGNVLIWYQTVSLLPFCFNVGLNTLQNKSPVNMLEETVINQILLKSGYYITWYLVSLSHLLSIFLSLQVVKMYQCALRTPEKQHGFKYLNIYSQQCTRTNRGERRQKKKVCNEKASG